MFQTQSDFKDNQKQSNAKLRFVVPECLNNNDDKGVTVDSPLARTLP